MGSTDPPAQARSPLAKRAQWPLLGLLFVAIAAVYLFFVTAGTREPDRVAVALLHGSSRMPSWTDTCIWAIQPSPELLAKANPYDHAHSKLWLWDATLHEGRYYLYWGPVPALLAAAVKSVAGRELEVGDGWLALAFVLGRLAVGMAILVLALRWLFPRLSPWLAAPAVAVFGLANPYLFGLGRVAVYEAAIEGAQFFLLAGLLLGMLAIGGAGSRRQPARARAAGGLRVGRRARVSHQSGVRGAGAGSAHRMAVQPGSLGSAPRGRAPAGLDRRAGGLLDLLAGLLQLRALRLLDRLRSRPSARASSRTASRCSASCRTCTPTCCGRS